MISRLFFVGLMLVSTTSWAQNYCPSGNLLKGKKPIKKSAVTAVSRLNDNKMVVEGSTWNGSHSSIFQTEKAFVTFDLKKETTIQSLLLQGDNNDTYEVSASLDGKSFKKIWTAPKHPRQGLRLRTAHNLNTKARYVRLGNGRGDKAYSVTEFQAFCKPQKLWPPNIDVVNPEKSKTSSEKDARKYRMAFKKITIAVLGLAVFLGLLYRRRRPELDWLGWYIAGSCFVLTGFMFWATWHEFKNYSRLPMIVACVFFGLTSLWMIYLIVRRLRIKVWSRRIETWALVVIAFTGGSNFLSYGTFHGSRAIHYWDSFHYYVGAKYFAENQYTELYNCSVIAELDDGRKSEFSGRQVRNLMTNQLGKANEVAKDSLKTCRALFADKSRWNAFRNDLRLFRSHMGKDWWNKMFKDHGFNASPVWSMVGVPIANNLLTIEPPPEALVHSPANLKGKTSKQKKEINKRYQADRKRLENTIGWFSMFDAACYVGLFLLIWWAFGLWGLAFSILVFGVGYPWAYFWTGGSFGRAPWLLMSTAGVCFLKRGFPILGGFSITWAMLLRVFPGALIIGVSIKMAWSLITKRFLSRPHLRIIAGCTLGVAVLVSASMVTFKGPDVYKEFLRNSFKHKETKLTNHMGLPTLMSFHPAYVARKARDNSKKDPFKKWKDMRGKLKEDRRWLHLLILVAFVGMMGYIGRRMEDWEVTALSTVFIVGIFELTCYYYSFLLLLALVAARRALYAVTMIAMVVAGQIIRLTTGWYDEQYTYETIIVLVAQAIILIGLCVETYYADKKDAAARRQNPGTAVEDIQLSERRETTQTSGQAIDKQPQDCSESDTASHAPHGGNDAEEGSDEPSPVTPTIPEPA